MLLPDIYHGAAYPHTGYGGLTGELPIFLALLAFSMAPGHLANDLPNMMSGGSWRAHRQSHGRESYTFKTRGGTCLLTRPGTNKRGVIVYVYTVDDNHDELAAYEKGELGNYYN